MVKNAREIPAGQFKAKCLAILDDVANSGNSVVVTKRGKAVARLVPIETDDAEVLRGSVTFKGDIVAPLDDAWEAAE